LIAGRECGWLAADVPALLRGFASDYVLTANTLHFVPHLADAVSAADEPLPVINSLLARVAAALSAAGRLSGWRDELLDVTDVHGHVVGVIERAAVRPLGIATHAVHLNAWTLDGEIWIAQRALTKNTDPGMWDTLVGGLISAGETPEIALGRESWEEAGLLPEHLANGQRVGLFRVERVLPEGYQVEIVSVVDCVLDAGVVPVNQDGEVVAIRRAAPAEILTMMEAGLFTLEAALSLLLSMASRGLSTGVDVQALQGLARP
jgi:8-oxo-dGTP pyrophosphatase MutT (NUDIX family)